MNDKPIRVLALCDTPTGATGFAQVSRNVLRGLKRLGNYEIDVIGINSLGDSYDREKHPYNIYPAMPQGYQDMYGRGRLINVVTGKDPAIKAGHDIIFTIQDHFIIEGMMLNFPFAEHLRVTSAMWKRQVDPSAWYKWIGYFPVDAPCKENWITRSIALCDYPVAYCEYGKKEIMKFDRYEYDTSFTIKADNAGQAKKAVLKTPSLQKRISVITHGVDTEVFKPLPKDEIQKFKKEFFGEMLKEDAYLVVNVSRNQPRKDLTRTLAAFAKFKERVPQAFLYLHCKAEDVGGSIHEMARNFSLIQGQDYATPKNFDAGLGYPVETINKIYNAADVCMTTTLGEGWGFITTEAMATKTPIVAPNITSILDIFDSYDYDGSISMLDHSNTLRGVPVKAMSNSSEWICLGLEDNERIRPLTNVDDMVQKLEWVYKNRNSEVLTKMVNRAYDWVHTLTWEKICQEWHELFQLAYKDLEEERKIGNSIDKVNPNEPCPCGSGTKFKKCHGAPDKMAKFKDFLA